VPNLTNDGSMWGRQCYFLKLRCVVAKKVIVGGLKYIFFI
jgi:hypothetical protein